jgi:uncharacterized membrane protein
MAGMLQIITYVLCFYLVVKGIEVFQIGLASTREDRRNLLTIGTVVLVACVLAALTFVSMQDQQAQSLSKSMSSITEPSP